MIECIRFHLLLGGELKAFVFRGATIFSNQVNSVLGRDSLELWVLVGCG
jgi:hypothetical protein